MFYLIIQSYKDCVYRPKSLNKKQTQEKHNKKYNEFRESRKVQDILGILIVIASIIFLIISLYSFYKFDTMDVKGKMNTCPEIIAGIVTLVLIVLFQISSKMFEKKYEKNRLEWYKKERLIKWSSHLKEIGNLNNKDSMDMLINCADERIKSEELNNKNGFENYIAGFFTAILIPTLIYFFKEAFSDKKSMLKWNLSNKTGIHLALEEIIVVILLSISIFVFALVLVYVVKDIRSQVLKLLYSMKIDLQYMKYLYVRYPGWDEIKENRNTEESTYLAEIKPVECLKKENDKSLFEINIKKK